MTVISSRSRSKLRSYPRFIIIGSTIGLCTIVARWMFLKVVGYSELDNLMQLPPPIMNFDKGNLGYIEERYCIDNSYREDCCSKYHCNMFVSRSTLYSECCNHVHNSDETTVKRGKQYSKLLPLLITSAPRSGTRFIQQLLTKVGMTGLTTDNHSPQNRGIVSWKHVFHDDHYIVGNKVPTHLYKSKFKVIWHLVRDPLKSLTSLAFTEPLLEDSETSLRYLRYVSKHISISNSSSLRDVLQIGSEEWESRSNATESEKIDSFLIYRGMEIWLHWHGFINYLNVPIFRLEDLSMKKNATVLDEVFHSVGIDPPPHGEVLKFLNDQEDQQRQRRLKSGRGRTESTSALFKNERHHREKLSWVELCRVHQDKARAMLQMSQSFGYYMEVNQDNLCDA